MYLKECPKNVVLIDKNDGMKIKILSNYGSDKFKIQMIDLGDHTEWWPEYKVGKNYVVEDIFGDSAWIIFKEKENTVNKVDNKSVKKLREDIEQMKKNVESAEKTLKEMEQKNRIQLKVGEMYKIVDNDSINDGFWIIQTIDEDVVSGLYIDFYIDFQNGSQFFGSDSFNIDDLYSSGTLTHMNSKEDKAFAKHFLKLHKEHS